MGNLTSKDDHGPTGSYLDLFHTPPTTPMSPIVPGTALPQACAPGLLGRSVSAGQGGPLSNPTSAWALVGLEGLTAPIGAGHSADGGRYADPPATPVQCFSPAWQKEDSGLERSLAVGMGDETTLSPLELREQKRAFAGPSPDQEGPAFSPALLQRLLVERAELTEEGRSLKETLQTERAEWLQFQTDLQVAVAVADRLRLEAEEELGTLRATQQDTERQLVAALRGQQETNRVLEFLRAQHKETCQKLSTLAHSHRQVKEELGALRAEHKETCQKLSTLTQTPQLAGAEPGALAGGEATRAGSEGQDTETRTEGEDTRSPTEDAQNGKELRPGGKGVVERCPRGVAVEQKRKVAEYSGKDPRRIVMLSERSRSLSRLTLPSESPSAPNGSSQPVMPTTGPLRKNQDPPRGRRADRILQRQDSWSSSYSSKREEHAPSLTDPSSAMSSVIRPVPRPLTPCGYST